MSYAFSDFFSNIKQSINMTSYTLFLTYSGDLYIMYHDIDKLDNMNKLKKPVKLLSNVSNIETTIQTKITTTNGRIFSFDEKNL